MDYTANEADFAWEGNSDRYKLVISSAADTLVDTVVVAAEYALAIEPETYYNLTVFVQGICPAESDTLSEASSKTFRFTAPASCPVVTNIEKVAVTENEADFSWDFGGDENEWFVRVIQTNVTPADTLFAENVSSNVLNVTSLQPNTAYTLRLEIVSLCAADDSSHVATASFSFSTPMPASYTQVLELGEEFAPDFDDAEERAKWGFLGAGEPNHFVFGSDPSAFVGEATTGLYVSNNDSAYAYTVNSTSASMVYRNFSVAADTTILEVGFSWQANGEKSSYSNAVYDFGRAFIISDSVEMTIGSDHTGKLDATSISYTAMPVNALSGDAAVALNDIAAGNWENVSQTVTLVGHGTYRLLFFWRNDTSGGEQNPFAVGGISLKVIGEGYDSSAHEDPDGFDNISGNGADEAQKFISNGHVFILHRGVIYDVTGRRVELK